MAASDIQSAVSTRLHIEKIQDKNALLPFKSKWNALLAESETKTVELTYEWQLSYWETFHQNSELFILFVLDADEIVAIAPLKRTLRGMPIRYLEIIAAAESNYQDLIIGRNTNEVLECIANYLIEHKKDWDFLNLRHIPETSKSISFFVTNPDTHPLRKIVETEKCAYLQINTSWEEHKKGLGKDRKHRMKNRVNKMEREVGPPQTMICESAPQFNDAMQEFFALHRKRWGQTETPSQFLDSRYCEFYSYAGSQLFSKGQLNIANLSAGGKTLAQLLYFNFASTSLIQLIAYDPAYHPYSPLLLLQEFFVEKSLISGVEMVDWGTYYPWKELWTNKTKNRVNLILFPEKIWSGILYALIKGYGFLRVGMRRSPFVVKWAKFLRSKTHWLSKTSSHGIE